MAWAGGPGKPFLFGNSFQFHNGWVPQVGGLLLSRIPGLADRDIPLPLLHPLLFITGTESHPGMASVLDDAGVADGLKIVATLNSYIGDMSDHGILALGL